MLAAALVGDYYHKEEWLQEALEKALAELVQLQFIQAEELGKTLALQPDWFILSKEGRIDPTRPELGYWLEPQGEEALMAYVRRGGRLLVWHSGMAGYHPESGFIQMVRGYFLQHPPIKPVTYRLTPSGKASGFGFEEDVFSYTAADEHYFTHWEKEKTELFLTASSEDGEAAAGWFHSYAEGYVVALTPSHTREALLDEQLGALLRHIVAGSYFKGE